MAQRMNAVSVPIRGLFNLTLLSKYGPLSIESVVSVPIRGLFNLTWSGGVIMNTHTKQYVSVLIRGLFNLTLKWLKLLQLKQTS